MSARHRLGSTPLGGSADTGAAAPAGEQPHGIARYVPVVGWLPRYEKRWFRGDLAAGIAVTALIVPKNLGYAGIAHVPLQNGLYAAAAGALIYALFCTSRQISTGPSSSLAAVAGGAVVVTGLEGDAAAQLVAAIALVTGLLFLVLAVFKLGRIAQFLSKAVVTGFLAGAAVDVVIGELPKLTGTSADGVNAWQELSSWVRSLDQIHWTTFVVGLVSLGVVFGLRAVAPSVPGALVLVVGGLVASYAFDLDAHGVALVGHVPRGLPSFAFPDTDVFRHHAASIVAASVALLLIGFSQTAGDARAFATRHRYRVDIDQESVAQGMANVGAGLFQGMPVSTSLSASSLNESAGASTPLASLITGGLMLLTLVVLAPLFSQLPKAVLAAVIIDAVLFGMIDLKELRRLRRVNRVDFWIAWRRSPGDPGRRARGCRHRRRPLARLARLRDATPPMPVLGRKPGTNVYREADEYPDDETVPGIAVVRSTAGSSSPPPRRSRPAARARATSVPPVRAVILDLEGVDFVDSQGSAKLNELLDLYADKDVSLRLARVKTEASCA